jgi:Tol biopolymer transport system component/DNA-binding winged helix-turn-helix (wHTH) protein
MAGRPDASDVFVFGPFELRAEDRSLWRDGMRVPLPPRAADILLVLVQNAGHLVERAQLKALWGLANVEDSSLNYQVHVVRQALRDGFPTECIETVRQRGFRFLPAVTVRAAPLNGPQPIDVDPAGIPLEANVDGHVPTERAGIASPGRPVALLGTWPRVVALAVLVSLSAAGFIWLVGPSQHVSVAVEGVEPVTHDGMAKRGRLLLDHRRVYYAEARDIRAWFAVPFTGGASDPVFDQPSVFQLVDVKQDGSEYLGLKDPPHRDFELWILRGSNGATRRVGSVRCIAAAWSPDGGRIACVHSDALHIVSADGVPVRRLTPPQLNNPHHIRWSPDGTKLRFTAQEGYGEDFVEGLWEIGDDSEGLRPLFRDRITRCCGDWTPDGRHYIFETRDPNGGAQLFALSEHAGWFGRPVRQVTQLTNDAQNYYGPRVSPDGRTVFALAVYPQGELVSFDRESQMLGLTLPGVSGTWVTYSPDRQSIAYIGFPDKRLWRARADGSDRQLLTPGVFEVDTSVWSPDGKWIAFRQRSQGQQFIIKLMPEHGGEPVPIGGTDGRSQGAPSWFRDGSKLVFGDVPYPYDHPAGDEALHEYDLTSHTFSVVPGSAGLWSPRWSPDGRYIAALTTLERAVRLFNTSSRRWHEMPVDHVDHMTWSSDSRFLHYHTEGNRYVLGRLRVADGTVEELTDLRHMPNAAYWWSGLTPDDRPLLLRRRGGTEIHALKLRFQPR